MAFRLLGGGRAPTVAPGSAGYRVEVRQDDLRDLVRAINQHGDKRALTKELRTGLREATKPLVPQARAKVATQTTSGGRSTGLRKDMARSVQVKVDLGLRSRRIGARIRLDGAKLERGGRPRGLVAMYEGTRPWRHPVFGTGKWVTQQHRGFLTETVDAGTDGVLRKIKDSMDDVGRKIDRGF